MISLAVAGWCKDPPSPSGNIASCQLGSTTATADGVVVVVVVVVVLLLLLLPSLGAETSGGDARRVLPRGFPISHMRLRGILALLLLPASTGCLESAGHTPSLPHTSILGSSSSWLSGAPCKRCRGSGVGVYYLFFSPLLSTFYVREYGIAPWPTFGVLAPGIYTCCNAVVRPDTKGCCVAGKLHRSIGRRYVNLKDYCPRLRNAPISL